ncbi:MAG: ribonuclease [Sphingomonas sp. 28-62-20]|uniref:ribonuclease n=1 Tax=Sphingomonas sp. 28-62-20 TaxID=1970433 RepID=UPI000BD33003|nr:MAG: ribonuclease [Sphingomonas sp. 28-62-20]
MAEWLYEAGIGEARAALVDGGRIIKARIALDGTLRVGTVAEARLVEQLPGRQGRVALIDGSGEALLGAVPPGVSVGRTLLVTLVREVIPEPGRAKLARAVVAVEGAVAAIGPDLLERLGETGIAVRHCRAHEGDALEEAGWSEVLEEAVQGEIAFPGGVLRMSPTPAMTLFDVDGSGPLDSLAVAAATAVGQAVIRLGIGGSIGVDFPSVQGKAARQAVAAAIDAALPPALAGPFERTALNGFGFLQLVRPRPRASLPELLRADPVGAAARAALRQIERSPPGGTRAHRLPPAVRARIESRPDWGAELSRRVGGTVMLED